ncbi:uncharacterized protein MYCFIDRAFT_79801 [Pseudocercospora fijiensis CIRAD86]|uniref:NTF2-like domain-containing protein n=1 Tax=Pseudocercospora fijiensis (strain CIRAD86) TaxID=383855 RepID=M3A344_PSEFD|nr:uncharacterized protein MYCFIDRAFT_79801 [Pseudocercospora fijiensis CIRAD86]EME79071.1 hypothetical protein MYCFIDRAFT_79801 [Pseudocercospora fijiensis CIRAD86]
MHAALTTLLSLGLATAALPAPEPAWARPQAYSHGFGGLGKKRQDSPPCNDTAPAPTATASTAPAPGTTGSPTPGNGTECPALEPSTCLTEAQANDAAEIFQSLIRAYTDELALEALTEDFIDYSSAVNIIRNRGNDAPFVVNEASFVGRAAFMAAQGAQPLIPFDLLGIRYGCDFVTVRWQTLRSAQGQATESNDIPVVGLGVLNTVPDSDNIYGFRVQELWSEFNSAAWLVNNGVFTPSAVTTTPFPEETAAPEKRAPAPWEWAGI